MNLNILLKQRFIFFLLFSLLFAKGYGQNNYIPYDDRKISPDSLHFIQIKTDTIFNSNQIISLLIIQKTALDSFRFEFAHAKSDLIKTSLLAESRDAEAAVNGSFFNMDSGGSVTYFEIDDTVISKTKDPELKWSKDDKLLNGAILILDNNKIELQPAQTDQFYEQSKRESAVLISGPLLLLNSKKMKLPDRKFVSKRHPRTCVCIREQSLLVITIDGRSSVAQGMNLYEAQDFLLKIGCKDALNLDGGGSTTMWIRGKGVVNFPSDDSGERVVSNALLIIKSANQNK